VESTLVIVFGSLFFISREVSAGRGLIAFSVSLATLPASLEVKFVSADGTFTEAGILEALFSFMLLYATDEKYLPSPVMPIISMFTPTL
jgi:hypothetical protein